MTTFSRFGVVVLTGLLLTATGAAADVRVLSSSAKTVEAGTELRDNTVLTLGAGEEVILLLPPGATKAVKGPFSGKVRTLFVNGGAVGKAYEMAKSFWKTGGRDTTASTGSRNAAIAPGADWRAIQVLAGVGDARHYCIEEGTTPSLARATGMTGANLAITDQDNQTLRTEIEWPSGSATMPWPSAMPVRNGGSYTIANSGAVARVTLRLVPVGGLAGDGALETLAGYKCAPQFEARLRQLAEPVK